MPQSGDLVMTVLGAQSGSPRWFGPALEAGIHLRWMFRPELGFPANGFTLSRRPHQSGTLVNVDVDPQAREVIFPELVRRVEVQFMRPGMVRPPSPRTRAPRIIGLLQGIPMTQADSAARRGRVVAQIESDAIDALQIDAPRGWRIERVRSVPIGQNDTGWQRLGKFCLPLRAPEYPCRPIAPNAAADWSDASARIPPEATPYYLGTETAPGESWQSLHASLHDMVRPFIPKSTVMTAPDDDGARAGAWIPDLLLLASIDPYVARVLGLYAVDDSAHQTERYDYKIQGHWLKTQLIAPETTIAFESSFVKRPFLDTFVREGAIFRCANPPVVERQSDAPWGDTRYVLDLHPFAADDAGPTPYLRIQFEEPVSEVQLYLRVFDGVPEASVPDVNVNLTRWASADGAFLIISLTGRTAADRPGSVVIRPASGTAALHLGVAKVGMRAAWLAPLSEPRSWTSYGAVAASAIALAPVEGVTAGALRTPARELPNGGVASGPRAGISWDLTLSGHVLAPGEPVRYLLQRQALGSGTAAAAIDPALWETIHRTDSPVIPVTVGTGGDASSFLYVDDPAVASGTPQPDRYYAYRVAPVDLFGRIGPYGSPAPADLIDNDPPPPPSELEAEYLEADHAIRLRWSWRAASRTQAPDAREFRVYRHSGALNAMSGRVIDVTPNADGTFTLTTDRDLPETAINALAGEWLRLGGVNFPIVGNSAGPSVSAIVRLPAAPPPALPATGPFTVTFRARRPLEGAVTHARGHLNGRVTLKTDQVTNLPQDALLGKVLRQAGRDYRILGSTSGALRIVVDAHGRSLRRAAVGPFTVIETAGGSTPVNADPGNPLWVDYRQAAHWSARVDVVQISAEERYELLLAADLTVSTESPIAGVSIAVSTADDKAYQPDDLRWVGTPFGDRPGNEGSLSAPLLVQRAMREPPLRPPPPDVGDGLTTAADYYGNSYIELGWTRIPGTRTEILRSLDETLFSLDRQLRSGRATDPEAYPELSDDEFNLLVVATPDYRNLTDALVTALARVTKNQAAFSLITPEPVEGDRYRVRLAGRSVNRHLFAVRSVDAAGNRSALSWPSHPVRTPRVLPPRAPVITRIVGGAREVTLYWTSNREADLHEYRIYRADSEAAARDVRLMPLAGVEPAASDPAARPREVFWPDRSIVAGRVMYYRLVTVDAAGNASSPSAVVAGRAYDETRPDPPVWDPPQVATPGMTVRLSWRAPVDDLTCLVERRISAGGRWDAVSRWLPRGTYAFDDTRREAGLTYDYRLRVRDGVNRQNTAFSLLTEV